MSNRISTKPFLISSANPSIGLSNMKVTVLNSDLICEFTRQKALVAPYYTDLSSNQAKWCFLFAEGKINETTGKLYFKSSKYTIYICKSKK